MQYPSFLKEGSTIGITAPSAGVSDDVSFEKSLNRFLENHWEIVETSNVRVKGDVSSSREERAKEFLSLYQDDHIDMIICATGGDFLTDMLPYLDRKILSKNLKWVMGASDPTNLLYYLTTVFDIATIYGHNAGSFDSKDLHRSQDIVFQYLKGDIVPQQSYDFYEENRENRVDGNYALTGKVEWKSFSFDFSVEGRIIGGCIDCLQFLPGTLFDGTKEFIQKYSRDGIIFYFDVFDLSSKDFYLTLFQFREAGWFSNLKAVIVGRILFPSTNSSMTYEMALREMFPNIPVIMDADIGHAPPKMTIINGSMARISYRDGKGILEQKLI